MKRLNKSLTSKASRESVTIQFPVIFPGLVKNISLPFLWQCIPYLMKRYIRYGRRNGSVYFNRICVSLPCILNFASYILSPALSALLFSFFHLSSLLLRKKHGSSGGYKKFVIEGRRCLLDRSPAESENEIRLLR